MLVHAHVRARRCGRVRRRRATQRRDVKLGQHGVEVRRVQRRRPAVLVRAQQRRIGPQQRALPARGVSDGLRVRAAAGGATRRARWGPAAHTPRAAAAARTTL